jgi:hypothetical protein
MEGAILGQCCALKIRVKAVFRKPGNTHFVEMPEANVTTNLPRLKRLGIDVDIERLQK